MSKAFCLVCFYLHGPAHETLLQNADLQLYNNTISPTIMKMLSAIVKQPQPASPLPQPHLASRLQHMHRRHRVLLRPLRHQRRREERLGRRATLRRRRRRRRRGSSRSSYRLPCHAMSRRCLAKKKGGLRMIPNHGWSTSGWDCIGPDCILTLTSCRRERETTDRQ